MSIINQLSSQTGERTEYSNRRVVAQCLDNPDLITDIASGLKHENAAIVGDCAEVLTHLAEYHPEWVAPFAADLSILLRRTNMRVRWEAMHALALIAALTPEMITILLPHLADLMRTDQSVIVRDYATEAVSAYAATSAPAAQAAFPLLIEMLDLWTGKQAGHALQGLVQVARQLPDLHPELHRIAEEYASFPRPVVRKAARILLNETIA